MMANVPKISLYTLKKRKDIFIFELNNYEMLIVSVICLEKNPHTHTL